MTSRLSDGAASQSADGDITATTIDLNHWTHTRTVRAADLPLPDNLPAQEVWLRLLYVPTVRDDHLAKSVDFIVRRNGGSQRRWLGIDGVADLGKTDMMLNLALKRSGITNGVIPTRGDYLHLPVLYIEASPAQRGAALTTAICNFARIIPAKGEEGMRKQLARLLPLLGTILIIVDDAHMLRRSSRSATGLSDTCRALLRLPVTFVFVGADLDNSALLKRGTGDGFETTDQLRRRCSRWDLAPLQLPRDAEFYDQMVRRYAARVATAIPDIKFNGLKRRTTRAELLDRTLGCHGSIFSVLKDATVAALHTPARDVTGDLIELMWPAVPGEPNELDPRLLPDLDVGAADAD